MKISGDLRKCVVLATLFPAIDYSAIFAQRAPPASNPVPTVVSESTTPSAFAGRYDVASVRQNLSSEPRWRMSFTDDGVSAMDVTLLYAIEEAYGVYDEKLWSGIPTWIEEKRFDINAKYDVEKYPHITLEQRRAMLQQLLAERFKLVVHHEPKEFPLYRLMVAKGGTKFGETKREDLQNSSTYGPVCNHLRSRVGLQEIKGCSMEQLAKNLTSWTRDELDRVIVDRTGLTGRYNFSLNWTPNTSLAPDTLDSGTGPSIFTALREQLGLQLQPEKGLLDTMVIDHVEMPTEN